MATKGSRWSWTGIALIIVLMTGCGSEESTTPEKPAITLGDERPFYRFSIESHGFADNGEVKSRVGGDYRNILYTLSDTDSSPTPATEHVSQVIQVPQGALLDFGIGLEQPTAPSAESVKFTLTAVAGDQETIVYENSLLPDDFIKKPGKMIYWVDERLELEALTGQQVQFRFTTSNSQIGRWGNPVLHLAQVEVPQDRPNLIMISLDTLGAAHLGCYGYERDTSPNLDRIVKDGILFENCMSPSSWTTPSHATAFTGLSPIAHGAGIMSGNRLRNSFTTISEIMRDEGYLTTAWTEGAAVGGQLGFYQGFDNYSNGNFPELESVILKTPTGLAEGTFSNASNWIDRYGHLPYMMFLHTYEIHWPYAPPEPYANRFTETPVDAREVLATMNLGAVVLTEDPAKRVIAKDLYDGGIAYTDAVLGNFFDHLEKTGQLENSIIVLFSDHGEAFWDHGLATHGTSLYRDMLHIPLFIRLPEKQFGGTRVSEPVALADIFPTILDLMDLPPSTEGSQYNLAPLFEADTTSQYTREVVGSHLWAQAEPLQWLMVAVESEKGKYIITSDAKNKESPIYNYKETLLDNYEIGKPEKLFTQHLLDGGRNWWTTEDPAQRNSMLLSGREELYLPNDVNQMTDEALNSEYYDLLFEFREVMMDYIEESVGQSSMKVLTEGVAKLTPEEIAELEALGYVFNE